MPTTMHVGVRTRSRDEAITAVQQVFPALRSQPGRAPDDGRTLFRQTVDGDRLVAYHRLAVTMPTRLEGDVSGRVVIGSPHSGRLAIEAGRHEVDTSRAFLNPLDRFEAAWSSTAGSTRTGEEGHRLRFTGHSPAATALEHYWLQVQRHLATVLTDPGMAQNRLIRGEAVRMTAAAVLLVFPNTTGQDDARSTPSPGLSTAVEFIEAHAHLDIGVADVARASGLPARRLTAAFRDQLGRTVLQHLRDERHRRARAELAAADPYGAVSVAEVAHRWGFTHLGRFAAEYAARFGESPSATLRR